MELSALEISLRAFFVFLLLIALLRISGRRSLGLKAPIDIVVVILLGSLLSRAIVGASPFFPTLGASLVIALAHRFFAFLSLNHFFGKILKGEKTLLFENGQFYSEKLRRCLVSKEDVMEEVRIRALVNSVDEIENIYMERDGSISVTKKN